MKNESQIAELGYELASLSMQIDASIAAKESDIARHQAIIADLKCRFRNVVKEMQCSQAACFEEKLTHSPYHENDNAVKALEVTEQQVLDVLTEEPMRLSEILSAMGIEKKTAEQAQVQQHIKTMLADGRIVKEGERRGSMYYLPRSNDFEGQ